MISFFRRFFQSKIGLPIFVAFLLIIALAFAAADITGTTFGGVAGNDRVASVGDERISTSELAETTQSALRRLRQQNPTMTTQSFVEEGGLDEVLDQLIDRYAIGGYAQAYGLRAGENLVNSEILQIPAFRGVSGDFDQQTYLAALRNQGIAEANFRRDLANGLLAQQLLVPAIGTPQAPASMARRYTALLRERRKGTIALIPSTAFVPEGDPTDEQLQAFYQENRSRYVRPERRIVRYTSFNAENVSDRVTPTTEEIAARYERDSSQYAAQETRTVSSFFVPTEDAANAITARIQGGVSLEAAAREAGFSVSTSEGLTRDGLAQITSNAVAQAVFAAPQGRVAQPARASLGWYIARVDAITRTPARSLAQATPAITEQLTQEKRAAALADFTARIEDRVDDRASLTEIAEEFDLQLETTQPLLANGRVADNPNLVVAEELRGALATAFEMDEAEPQLAEVTRGEEYIVFEVEEIVPSAAAPLNEIRERVEVQWRLAEGDKLARETADRVLAATRGGSTLAEAMRAEETRLPPVETIDLDRRQLVAQRNQRIPPPLALMFSMAAGTTKQLEAANDLGWYIVDLEEITTDPVAEDDPQLEAIRGQLAQGFADEYAEQLASAMRNELGVERNDTAIEAVRQQLVGNN